MHLEYASFERSQGRALAEFLAGSTWPFHVDADLALEDAVARIESGEFDGPHDRTYWVTGQRHRVGVLHLQDLDDDTPLFDIRIRQSDRGQGIGTAAVTWLTATVFDEFPELHRIEANTRQDNAAMRRVLHRCGYVKEAHYRQAWPSRSGQAYDSIGYAIIRKDWEQHETTPVDWNDGP